MSFRFGLIEGMYDTGPYWNWLSRESYVEFCVSTDQGFYIYAPKDDLYLREKWEQDWPEEEFLRLKNLSDKFKKTNTVFGIGITPHKMKKINKKNKEELLRKMNLINEIDPYILCILFDDFSNKDCNAAKNQADIAHYIAGISKAKHIIMVGTWYSHDALLTRVYGEIPENYLEDLGRFIDPSFDIFWTGDHVISLGYDKNGLLEVAEKLRRKPFLWDNYPVNDPVWLKDRLRIYALTGRPWELQNWTSGHAINLMRQPWMSMIPAASLSKIYCEKQNYNPHEVFKDVLFRLCDEELAHTIEDNLVLFTLEGNKNLSSTVKERLRKQFKEIVKEPSVYFAKEVIRWLGEGDE